METIVNILFGSHLYGTANSLSDKDYKGVYFDKEEVIFFLENNKHKVKSLLNNTSNNSSKNTNDDVDDESYSLPYFIKLALEGQTVALDMLHAPPQNVIETSSIWEFIVANKSRFYSKNINTFVHYARNQAAKYGIKGSRLDACKEVINFLESWPEGTKLKDVWEKLPDNDHQHFIEDSIHGLRQYCVVGKTLQETMRVEYCKDFLKKYYDEYGDRAHLAKDNKGVDWKAISHAIRACFQVKQLIEEGTITFPLKEAPLLLDIKEGKLDYTTEAAPLLENMMETIEEQLMVSNLPETTDNTFWMNWLHSLTK